MTSKGAGTPTSVPDGPEYKLLVEPAPAQSVRFERGKLFVELADGREIAAPVEWFPLLAAATPAQRALWQVDASGFGVHWPEIDEDISVAGLFGLSD